MGARNVVARLTRYSVVNATGTHKGSPYNGPANLQGYRMVTGNAAEGALNGYLWGITLGFAGGTIFALYQAGKSEGNSSIGAINETARRQA